MLVVVLETGFTVAVVINVTTVVSLVVERCSLVEKNVLETVLVWCLVFVAILSIRTLRCSKPQQIMPGHTWMKRQS